MWTLQNIYASNLCAFKELSYEVLQKHTTLVFGNNLDNDSQGSNGSGKSAMLEAIAIALTGETLRKVKMDEIINDAADQAQVDIVLHNTFSRDILEVKRTLSRKSPQTIQIFISPEGNIEKREEIKQAGVSDYNKCVLDYLGLSKDDIFTNFILSKHKYSSFLSSSDREKKEIINRFSNGVLVDESIAALQADMEPIKNDLLESEKTLATCEGQVSAIENQIEDAKNEAENRQKNKAERIAAAKQAIVDKRAYIREQDHVSDMAVSTLEYYDDIDLALQDLEKQDKDIVSLYNQVKELFQKGELSLQTDYSLKIQDIKTKQAYVTNLISDLERQRESKNEEYTKLLESLERIEGNFNNYERSYERKVDEWNNRKTEIDQCLAQFVNERNSLQRQIEQVNKEIAGLKAQLAGTITCPKCKYEFILSSNADVSALKSQLKQDNITVTEYQNHLYSINEVINDNNASKDQERKEIDKLQDHYDYWKDEFLKANKQVDCVRLEEDKLLNQINDCKDTLERMLRQTKRAKQDLFDEAFNILDEAIKKQENINKTCSLNVDNALGVIASYEESIKEMDASNDDNLMNSLQENLRKYNRELEKAILRNETIECSLNELRIQETTFVEFKTHLANTKINALSHITNEFLERIGSDIRIVFSGYTILKSGKVRDKISISLMRDGIDCGSFDKFSEGEKARVNLANILAMHKLTNTTCDEGKGLDLLVLDEILEATDEQGLSNIFEALNQLEITALVVSHGNIAENYPYKTVITKQNGVSFINGNEKSC